jgi:hypothetical protein
VKNQRIVVAKEASKGCSIHVEAPIRVALSLAPKRVFELISAYIRIRRATRKNSHGSHCPTRPWKRPHLSPVRRENGPVFKRTDSPLRLLELIRLRVQYFIRSLRFESSADTTSVFASGRWKFLQNSVRNVFPRHAHKVCGHEMPRAAAPYRG